MSYTINNTAGRVITTIADGSVDNTTNLTLIGKNYPGYGQILNDNLIRLLENAANSTAPLSPLSGQLFYNTSTNVLQVYSGTGFRPLASLTSSAYSSPPSTPLLSGDLWWDTTNQQLKAYSGSAWVTVGPAFSAGVGTSGAVVETIASNLAVNNTVVSMYAGNTRIAIFSKSDPFTPGTSVAGFPIINPGVNLANVSVIPGVQLTGLSSNADLLDSLNSTDFMRSTANTSTTGTLAVNNNTGLTVGSGQDAKISVLSSDVYLENMNNAGSMYLRVRDSGGTQTNAAAIASTGAITFAKSITVGTGGNLSVAATTVSTSNSTGALTVSGGAGIAGNVFIGGNTTVAGNLAVTGGFTLTGTQTFNGNVTFGDNVGTDVVSFNSTVNTNILPAANNTYNLGSTGSRWASIWGVSSSAQYADLAERYEADDNYSPGTVMTIGGEKEVTVAHSWNDVFGVVSTAPAYLMNDAAGTNATHPPIALVGRVPVRVVGPCNKGDKLVAHEDGTATKWIQEPQFDTDTPTANIDPDKLVGRALVDKYTQEEELIEVVLSTH